MMDYASSEIDTSPSEINSSFEGSILADPHRRNLNLNRRKLTFDTLGLSESDEEKPPAEARPERPADMQNFAFRSISNDIRSLSLMNTPATPNTILHKLKLPRVGASSKALKYRSTNNNILTARNEMSMGTPPRAGDNTLTIHHLAMRANLNPFTPEGLMYRSKKRCRVEDVKSLPGYTFGASQKFVQGYARPVKDSDMLSMSYLDTDAECLQAPKRIALDETDISRYSTEFVELEMIGTGDFGVVYRCRNKLDGCDYAIKKSKLPLVGSHVEKLALNEVWAHAVLGKHENVVRYYSAWAENKHMIIQNEYCNGGSLLKAFSPPNKPFDEAELRTVLVHIAEGLRYIHSHDLAHMDIKSGNIFLSTVPRKHVDGDEGFDDSCDEAQSDSITTYKIGDLGLVTSIQEPHCEEGDSGYLAKEILENDYSNLQKCDIFSLGITLYEAATGKPLPNNGEQWHELRSGQFPDLPNLSKEFNKLLKQMMDPKPELRPSSTSIFNNPLLYKHETKSKAQLSHELSLERERTHILQQKLKEATKVIQSYEHSQTPIQVKTRIKRESTPKSDRKLRSQTQFKKLKRRSCHDSRRNIN